jgi:hypothetical protein
MNSGNENINNPGEEEQEQPSLDNPFEETQQDVQLTPEQMGELEALAQTEEGTISTEVITDPYQIAETLNYAIANNLIVYLSYTKMKDRSTQEYEVEPLEIASLNNGSSVLWVWDTMAQRLKSLMLGNINFIQLTGAQFIRMIH